MSTETTDLGNRPPSRLAFVLFAAALNLPFLLGHPDHLLVENPIVRSLTINAVLFVVPGWALIALLVGRGWMKRINVIGVVLGSFALFLAAVFYGNVAAESLDSGRIWNAQWVTTNVLLILNVLFGNWQHGWPALRFRDWLLRGTLFLASYLLFFYGAVSVVPPMEDHDFELQCPGYGLLTDFEPLAVTDRNSVYNFAHPQLFHFYLAGSFLYFDQLEPLKYYHAVAERVRDATQSDATQSHDGTARDQGDEPIGLLEHGQMCDYYEQNPYRLETRTPNLFLAAFTVALMGGWLAVMTGRWWAPFFAASAYAISPEIFVRSSYGGYFAISNFSVLLILIAISRRETERSRSTWAECFACAVFAALVNHKLVLLPAAVGIWELVRHDPLRERSRWVAACFHPVVLGFVAGTAVNWIHGLTVDAGQFWQEHVRAHLIDRVTDAGFLHESRYPSVPELWAELWRHTGYIVLPLGLLAMLLGLRQNKTLIDADRPRATFGLWVIWSLILACMFSYVDWRHTKHLMPLLLLLFIAPTVYVTSKPRCAVVLSVLFAGLIVWSWDWIGMMAFHFPRFHISPCW